MHVLFDARLLHRSTSGLERVQQNLLRGLAAHRDVTRLRALVRRGTDPALLPAGVEGVPVQTAEDVLAVLLADGPAERPDVLHMTFFPDRNPRDLLLPAAARGSVVSVTDAILNRHPDYFPSAGEHAWYHRFVRALVQSADRVLSYTRSAAREAVDDLGADPARVDVASLAVDPALATPLPAAEVATHLARLGVRGPYLLAVGKDYPHKDHATLLRALARLPADVRLLCAGARVWHGAGEPFDALARRLGLAERVRWIEGEGDAAVKALLQGSLGLIYPSREEGFGLPPLEAMTLGIPVVAAAAMSIPEVCGDGAWLFEPGRDDQLATFLATLRAGGDPVREQAARGRDRAATFTWERAVDGVVRSYGHARAAAAERRGAPACSAPALLDLLAIVAAAPFHEAFDLAAWQERCHHVERHLQDVLAHRDELERRLRGGKPPSRWSLRRRIGKLRQAWRGRPA